LYNSFDNPLSGLSKFSAKEYIKTICFSVFYQMTAVGVPQAVAGVAKRRFLRLFMRLIIDRAAIQQVIFTVFRTVIFLSG
jgi:hypothetical protein